MDLSLRQLEEAVSLRRQIDALERRFADLVGGGRATSSAGAKTGSGKRRPRRTMSAATRAKIVAAARARWARRVRGGRKAGGGGKKSRRGRRMSAMGRKKLSDMMKARWAARRKTRNPGTRGPIK
jgi:hypothetical protein